MFCRSCGSAQPDEGSFCTRCGVRLAVPVEGPEPTAYRPPAGTFSRAAPAEPPPRRRRGRALAFLAAAVVVLGGLAVTGWREHWPPGVFGATRSATQGSGASRSAASIHSVPPDATRVVTNLVSRDPAKVRNSLAKSYSAQVSSAVLAPAGTQVRVLPGTWRQRGSDASMSVSVTVPGRAPVTETVYLVREGGRWRILFTDAP
jgi:hypothetical protein